MKRAWGSRLGTGLFWLGVWAWTLAGCATGEATGDATGTRSRGSNVITAEEARETSAYDAYQVVQLLRPVWLRPRAAPSLTNPGASYARIYVDNVPLAGGIRDLRNVAAGDIFEIRYISPADATTRFGTGHSGGVIMVITRRGV